MKNNVLKLNALEYNITKKKRESTNICTCKKKPLTSWSGLFIWLFKNKKNPRQKFKNWADNIPTTSCKDYCNFPTSFLVSKAIG